MSKIDNMASNSGVKDTSVISVYKMMNRTVKTGYGAAIDVLKTSKIYSLKASTSAPAQTMYDLVIRIEYSPVNPSPQTIAADINAYLSGQYAPLDPGFDSSSTTTSDPTVDDTTDAPVPPVTAPSDSTTSSFPMMAVIGACVGGVVIIAIVFAVAVWRRSRKQNAELQNTTAQAQAGLPVTLGKTASLSTNDDDDNITIDRNYMQNPMSPQGDELRSPLSPRLRAL